MFPPTSSRRFRFIVFDWDGTLADSTAQIARAVRAAYADLSLPVPAENAARFIIGLKLDAAFRALSPGASDATLSEISRRYVAHYLTEDASIPLFEGARELLADLDDAGYFLGVATGKSRKGLKRSLETHRLTTRFHATRTADEGAAKPSPQMLLDLMRMTGTEPNETLMIGDTTHDVLMAKNARVASLAVSYGAHDVPTLSTAAPDAIAGSVEELRKWLEKNG